METPHHVDPIRNGRSLTGPLCLYRQLDHYKHHHYAKDHYLPLVRQPGRRSRQLQTQEEVDTLWNKLIAGSGSDPVKSGRAMQAMLKMKKLDIKALEGAYEGNKNG